MGFRIKRSFKIAPGVRIGMSRSRPYIGTKYGRLYGKRFRKASATKYLKQTAVQTHLLTRSTVEKVPTTLGSWEDPDSVRASRIRKKTGLLELSVATCLLSFLYFFVCGNPTIAVSSFIALLALVPFMHKKGKTLFYNRSYNLRSDQQTQYDDFCESFGTCAASECVWSINERRQATSSKRSTVTDSLTLKPLRVGFGNHRFIVSDVTPPMIAVSTARVFFMPNEVLIFNGNRFASIKYCDIQFDWRDLPYVSKSHPSDATIIGGVWEHQNNDGSRDLRYKSNRNFPQAHYSLLNLSHPLFFLEIVFSKAYVAKDLCSRLSRLK